ncbi:cobyric acid synthase [Metabacillus malikii]|uniref:Cobyric acid synthase n=1 Tax=Metabacillus malikii TaxID=1504265 RepID=A0ABT9Z9R4_9BACI|nr:cobyric acid synthase [Metabacillus malikii]MDQ0228991.1 adenosylcobyric acid synthase [Metabacillus malikii]
MNKAVPLMIQGTHSDAGKSAIVTAFCRIFVQQGYKTAPFKSQNMALNSYITIDGKEIGRAQGVQAEAANIIATTDMNPILIKPSGIDKSQIVVNGKPYKNMEAGEYRQDYFETGLQIIREAYERLASSYERIVIEGAGSPAEINLNDRELVNMRVAKIADAPVILVGDIEKGGVFASLVGTLQLLEQSDRKRIIGVVINKFRGDVELLRPGLDWFEQYTDIPVLGVIPYIDDLFIEAEDSVVLNKYTTKQNWSKELDIAVIRHPFISNFTDLDPLMDEQDCHVRFVQHAEELGHPDLLILPGSKNTLADMKNLHKKGLTQAILDLAANKTVIIGICGGYQMLGKMITDPYQVESSLSEIEGLNLLPMITEITQEKTTINSEGIATYLEQQYDVKGYEIHMGETNFYAKYRPFIKLVNSSDGAMTEDGQVIGTYFHGLFHNDDFRIALLNQLRIRKGLEPLHERQSFSQKKEAGFELLAKVVKENVQFDRIETLMEEFQQRD